MESRIRANLVILLLVSFTQNATAKHTLVVSGADLYVKLYVLPILCRFLCRNPRDLGRNVWLPVHASMADIL